MPETTSPAPVTPEQPIVTLLTDFGLRDEYVGVLKGVILSHNPKIRLVDISHLVAHQDIRSASHLLMRSYSFFPAATVHLAVVDPGVGTKRGILALAADGYIFIGPDNGLFTPLLKSGRVLSVYRVTESHFFNTRVSNTFHGRDIMAPVAAQLAGGLAINKVGPPISPDDCLQIDSPSCFVKDSILHGEITHIDNFGNLCTNIEREDMEEFVSLRKFVVRLDNNEDLFFDAVSSSYGASKAGTLLLLYDSHDFLEIAVAMGSAAKRLQAAIGSRVAVMFN